MVVAVTPIVLFLKIEPPDHEGGAGQAPVVPNPRISTHRGGIHVTRMKKELVYDVHTDMMSMPPEGLKEYSVLIVAYPFRKTKTSDFFDANIRTFEAKHGSPVKSCV